jgi:hypothetical protein
MCVALNNIADWLRELSFRKRIRSYKVLNPIALLGDSDEEYLCTRLYGGLSNSGDPTLYTVHIRTDGLRHFAMALALKLVGMSFSRIYRQSQTSGTTRASHSGGQRGRPSAVAALMTLLCTGQTRSRARASSATGDYSEEGRAGGRGGRSGYGSWPGRGNRGGHGGRFQVGGGRRFHRGQKYHTF